MDFDASRWMANLAPEVRVIDSYIPGSHDASAYPVGNDADSLKWMLGAVTHSSNYTGQLVSGGSRYFDMRINRRWKKWGDLYMKHSEVNFQPFSEVLDQLINFSSSHPTETIFMDLDFTGDIENEVMDMLLKKFGGEGRFTSKHVSVGPDGAIRYNTDLTWGDLAAEAKAGRNFVIIWQSGQPPSTPRVWAPPSSAIRDDPFDDFSSKSPKQIIDILTGALNSWDKTKLMLTQLINTPGFSPFAHPEDKDREAAPIFNPWLMSHGPGSKLNVVKRDFVNSRWNENAIAYLIKLNRWMPQGRFARQPIGDPVLYSDWVRIKSDDGRYLAVSVYSVDSGRLCVVRTTADATPDTNFILREKSYTSTASLTYSGNPDADATDANGNMRFVHVDTREQGNVGDNTVLSQDKTHDGQVFWGVGWGYANDMETVLPCNPDYLWDTSQISYGSRFLIRSLGKLFWRVVYGDDADTDDLVFASADQDEATTWEFEKGIDPRLTA